MSFTFTKTFILAYVFTYVVLSAIGINLYFVLSPIPTYSNPLASAIYFIPNILIFIVNFFTFSTPYVIVNVVFWIGRLFMFIEMLPVITDILSGIAEVISKFIPL